MDASGCERAAELPLCAEKAGLPVEKLCLNMLQLSLLFYSKMRNTYESHGS